MIAIIARPTKLKLTIEYLGKNKMNVWGHQRSRNESGQAEKPSGQSDLKASLRLVAES